VKIVIKNQLNGTIDLCIGMQEYWLKPEEEILAPVPDGDYIYLDQLTYDKSKQSPAETALSNIIDTMRQYRMGMLTRLDALTKIGQAVSKYFDTEKPIPYELTDKAGADDDKEPA